MPVDLLTQTRHYTPRSDIFKYGTRNSYLSRARVQGTRKWKNIRTHVHIRGWSKTSFSRYIRRLIAVTLVSYAPLRFVFHDPRTTCDPRIFRVIDARYFTLARERQPRNVRQMIIVWNKIWNKKERKEGNESQLSTVPCR